MALVFECINKKLLFELFDFAKNGCRQSECKVWITHNFSRKKINFGANNSNLNILHITIKITIGILRSFLKIMVSNFHEQYIYHRSTTTGLIPIKEKSERIRRQTIFFETIKKNNLEKIAEDFRTVYNRA